MKQKDIIIIIVVTVAAALLAVLISKFAIPSGDRQQKAEVVQSITPDFQTTDQRFFNANSIDPTLQIQIGDNSNPDPFRGATN
jgi:hypothetical protein